MSYVHPFSKRCDKSEVDLFRVPPTQQSLERGRWIDYAPLSSVENANSAITFLIAGTDEYIDLSKTILTVTGKITKKDGESKLDGNDQSNVAPVNNFLHSLFRQVDVYLNGKQVTPAMGTYAYRSYIETLLNYDVSAKQSQFSSALYYKDTPGQMEKVGALASSKTLNYKTPGSNPGDVGTDASDKLYVPESGNVGFAKRHQFIKNGNRFVLSGPIFADIFMTDRLLLNMMDLKVVLNRSSDAFCLFEKGNDPAIEPKVQLSDVVLKVRKVKVDQSISDGVERMLKQTPALYPIRRVECKILTIPANLPNVRQDNIFSGIIPNSFVVGLVHVDATTGEYDKNPYNFQHFGVTIKKNNVRIDIETLTEHIEYILNNYKDAYTHAIDRLTREELLLDVFHEMDVNSLGRAMSYLTLIYRTSHKIKEDTVRQAVRLVAPVIRNTGRVEGSFIRELCAWGRSFVLNLWDLL